MVEATRLDLNNEESYEIEILDTKVKKELWNVQDEVNETEDWVNESIEIIWVDKRIDYWIEKSLQFNFLGRAILSENQREKIKDGITTFFKNITYQDGNAVIVYETDAKIISAINSFLTSEIRDKIRNNWSAVKMEQIIHSVVGWTTSYPKNEYVAKKKSSDWSVKVTDPDAIKTTIINCFKTVLDI